MYLRIKKALAAEIALINDVNINEDELYQNIIPLLRNSHLIRVVNAEDCTLELYEEIIPLIDKKILFVFPGQGALDVKSRLLDLEIQFSLSLNIQAKRSWQPGESPKVEISWPEVTNLDIEKVVVIDDVISSGETVLTVKKQAPDFLQRLPWNLLTWVFKKSSRKVLNNEFESCFAVFDVKSPSGNMAINSLSTLIKKEEVLISFTKKHSVYPERLFRIIKELDN